jgi:enoyl-CoA hydratase
MDAAQAMAQRILENGPVAVRAVKESVQKGLALSFPEAMEFELKQAATVFASEDAREGPLAFLQKRKPEWKGK